MAEALRHQADESSTLAELVDWAATFHDLGKLEAANQEMLRNSETGKLPVNHVDAGSAYLCALKLYEAAMAVYGHHRGLCDMPAEKAKEQKQSQDPRFAALRDFPIKLQTDTNLQNLCALHDGVSKSDLTHPSPKSIGGFERRFLLSCLVDADHFDTAHHYQQESEREAIPCLWNERIVALDRYVEKLSAKSEARGELRSQIYAECRNAPDQPIWACDSPVGSGKTTAVMAYLLRVAQKLGLRHIFVVLPFTNIVNQSVEIYRKALTLPGENAERVVAAHHHGVEFQSPDLRYLTTLWESPVIVTTAVQFFETLAAHRPTRLRKLHQLPGSAVFIDEAHAAMPIHLWPYMWDQLVILSRYWNCRFVLASGSLAKFWENDRIMGAGRTVHVPLMIPEPLRTCSAEFEGQRILYQRRPEAMTLPSLCDWIQATKGSRLVVVNTVHSAGLLAAELERRKVRTLHMSTALAPAHRAVILRRARRYLKWCPNLEWVMVATSCIEAGVDLSFTTAFRERSRVSSLLQIGGRVNRHGNATEAEVWDFVVNDPRWKQHPQFDQTRPVVEEVFAKQMWKEDPASLTTYALEQEFKRHPQERKIADLHTLEKCGDYPEVAKSAKLIDSDTRFVVIDRMLAERIRSGEKVGRHELQQLSVQLWAYKINQFRLEELGYGEEIYEWPYTYDSKFLGIMAGVLELEDIDEEGCAFV